MSLQTFLYRRMCTKADAKRDAGLTVPDDLEITQNLPYSGDPKWQILDLYRPKQRAGRLPVIVSFHGGGWVYGTKETYRFYCMSLAQQGFAVVNPTYRLAPEHRFPAAFADIAAVYAFVMQHADEYEFDTEHIFGIGDSSGANGTAAFALLLTNPDYAAKFPVKPPEGLRLCGIGLNCGVYSMEGKKNSMRDLLPKENPDAALDLLDIPKHITAAFPPCYLMTARGDFNASQPQTLIPALKRCGVPYQCKIWGDAQNPLGHVFHCNMRDAHAAAANSEELAFFRALL